MCPKIPRPIQAALQCSAIRMRCATMLQSRTNLNFIKYQHCSCFVTAFSQSPQPFFGCGGGTSLSLYGLDNNRTGIISDKPMEAFQVIELPDADPRYQWSEGHLVFLRRSDTQSTHTSTMKRVLEAHDTRFRTRWIINFSTSSRGPAVLSNFTSYLQSAFIRFGA